MNKDLIKQRFKRKLDSYNENARIQKQMAERLINMIVSHSEEALNHILEIGCGTGLLTKLAADKFPFSSYTALDIVPECEGFIKNIRPDIEFVSVDIEEYVESTDKTFDLIISNASLQWVENLTDFTEKIIKKLNPNGKLLFSTFGKENFREIFYVLGKTLNYYSPKELSDRLIEYHPTIEEEVRIMAFNTPKDVLKHIQNTGVNAISSEVWTKKDLISFDKNLSSPRCCSK
jgi:malonyl-CoA O-methyltransferase